MILGCPLSFSTIGKVNPASKTQPEGGDDVPKRNKELPDFLYTVEEVAAILKVNKNKVYDLIRKGYLTALKLGRYKVTKFELIRFLKEYNGKDLSDLDNIKELKAM